MIQRVLRNTLGSLSFTFYQGSTPADADGAVTVDVARADGTLLINDGSTTFGGTGTGRYSFDLDPQSALELFTITWTGTFGGKVQSGVSQCEIVGGYYVSLVDLKAESGLGTKSDAVLAEARQWFEEKAEHWTGRAFVPRFEREVLDGTGGIGIKLKHVNPRTILSCEIDGIAQSGLETWDLYESGDVIRDTGSFPWGRRNVEITYEHGLDQPDADLREAALVAIRARVIGDTAGGGIPAGVTQLTTDAGVYEFGRRTFPTGLPEVDDVLRERRVPLVA